MGARQRAWGRERLRQLREVLGGRCADPLCDGSSDELAIDHVDGRDYSLDHMSTDQRATQYWREYHSEVRLRVLCRKCNGHPRNNPGNNREEAEIF